MVLGSLNPFAFQNFEQFRKQTDTDTDTDIYVHIYIFQLLIDVVRSKLNGIPDMCVCFSACLWLVQLAVFAFCSQLPLVVSMGVSTRLKKICSLFLKYFNGFQPEDNKDRVCKILILPI